MSILFVLIPLGLVLLAVAVAAFFWAVRSGQFDDLDTPGTMVLFDEEPAAGEPAIRVAGEGR
jgi:cbb3-type cytochrome oxidase maturation protein